MASHATAFNTSITNSSITTINLVSCKNGRKMYRVRGNNFEVPEHYSITSVVGHGAYGIVCAAVDEKLVRNVAIKRISRVFDDLIDGRRIWREMVILRHLRKANCRNVLRLQAVLQPLEPIHQFKDLYIVTDLYECDLYTLIRQKKEVRVSSLRNISAQILRALADMHSMGIIHRDVKPSNVIMNAAEDCCLCDFGLARGGVHLFTEPANMTDYVVTRWYRAPELLLMCHYHFPVDVWAVACLMAEFVLQRPLFAGRDYVHQLQLVVQTAPLASTEFVQATSRSANAFLNEVLQRNKDTRPLSKVLLGLPVDVIDVMQRMLSFDPKDRLTARQALQHPFFESVGGEGQEEYPQPPNEDFSFDMSSEISESQLRRKMWDETEFSNGVQ